MSSKKLRQGIHADVPMEAYVNDPCPEPSLSASAFADVLVSPLLAKTRHPRLGSGKREFSRAADLGSAAHAAALEGDEAIQVITEKYPDDWKTEHLRGEHLLDYRTVKAKKIREKIYDAGKIPILMHEAPVVEAIRKSLDRGIRLIGQEYGAAGAQVEQTVVWQENGVWCRCRPDVLLVLDSPPGAQIRPCGIIDAKTSKSADPDQWTRRVMWPSNHDLRAAWYIRGVERVTGNRVPHVFLLAETAPPHDWSWVTVPGESLHLAFQLIDIAVEMWGSSLRTGKWTGYPKTLQRPEMPRYRAEAFEDLIDDHRHNHPDEDVEVFGGS